MLNPKDFQSFFEPPYWVQIIKGAGDRALRLSHNEALRAFLGRLHRGTSA
ncbi:hypothetical protein [Nostoc sp.]